jgi:hypothetical protein
MSLGWPMVSPPADEADFRCTGRPLKNEVLASLVLEKKVACPSLEKKGCRFS